MCNSEIAYSQKVTSKVTDKWQTWLTKDISFTFSFSEHLLGQLSDYIQACIRLSWRMVTQVPPMQLEYQSSILRDIHKKMGYHRSPQMLSGRQPGNEPSQAEEISIAYYLWPGLFDAGGRLIRAGEVLCWYEKEEVTLI